MTEIKFKIGDIVCIENYKNLQFNDNFKAEIINFRSYNRNQIKIIHVNLKILNGFLYYKDKYNNNYYKSIYSCLINIPISKVSLVKQENYTIY